MKFLKWNDDVIGEITENREVHFLSTCLQIPAVKEYIKNTQMWTEAEFISFLSDRVVSSGRRDIEKILFRCGLSKFSVIGLAEKTKAINAKDLFWITDNPNETFENAINEAFKSIFIKQIDMTDNSLNSPDGMNIKRYGVYEGRYGIFKERLYPLSKDVECEVAVYQLAKKMGIPCCKAVKTDENTVFSQFQYDFAKEQIIHYRRLFENQFERTENQYENIIRARPMDKIFLNQMMLLDFITRQDDRHLSNIAFKRNILTNQTSFYPLYDNGRSLFYEDTRENIEVCIKDFKLHSTSFGPTGSYYDYICDILKEKNSFGNVNLRLKADDVYNIYKNSGLKDYQLDGAVKWTCSCLDFVKSNVLYKDIEELEI